MEDLDDVSLAIAGMKCPNCAMRVRNHLISISGVISASVNHRVGIARVRFNPDLVQLTDLVNAVAQAGTNRHQSYFVFLAQMEPAI